MTQEFTFETDSLDHFTTALATFVPILFARFLDSGQLYVAPAEGPSPGANEHPSRSAAWFLHRRYGGVDAWRQSPEAREPLYWPICQLRWNWSDATPTTGGYFASTQDAVEETVRQLRAANLGDFWERCGPRGVFTGDGSVGPGYRAHWSSSLGQVLAVSLCHIYYSK